ncbi:MAG: hypothetical protein IPK79_06225 [Vampirovibrionales bacterium]|nr:hypothetical protein [Vampirovibrionales bacterium]
MAKRFSASVWHAGLTAGALIALTAMSACGGAPPPPATPSQQAPATQGTRVSLTVRSVDQMAQLGSKLSDGGQYLLVGVTLKNETAGDVKFDLKDFLLRKKNAEGATTPVYEQGVEPEMDKAFIEQFGKESEQRLINPESPVHAGFEIEKVLIYNIPKNDGLDGWQLRYGPSDVVKELSGPDVKVTDHRIPAEPEQEGR